MLPSTWPALDPGGTDVEVYKLVAQVIPTLLIAISIEGAIKWAKDPAIAREQAGVIAAIGLIAMVGFAASLIEVAAETQSALLFCLTFFPLFLLAVFVVILPAYGGGKG